MRNILGLKLFFYVTIEDPKTEAHVYQRTQNLATEARYDFSSSSVSEVTSA